MAELQKSLQPSPAQSVQYSRSRAMQLHAHSVQQQSLHQQPPHQLHHHQHQQHPLGQSSATLQLQQHQPDSSCARSSSSSSVAASSSTGPATASTSAATTTLLRRDVPPVRTPAQGQSTSGRAAAQQQLARKSLSFSSQDLARYLCEIIRDADQHPETAPFDSLQVFSTEGGGSPAGSLSSFSSAGLDEDHSNGGGSAAPDSLREWGPRFEKLKALYERAEASDL